MMNRVLAAAVLLTMGSWLAACNTTRGLGEDVEATGEAVQDAAQKAEDNIKAI